MLFNEIPLTIHQRNILEMIVEKEIYYFGEKSKNIFDVLKHLHELSLVQIEKESDKIYKSSSTELGINWIKSYYFMKKYKRLSPAQHNFIQNIEKFKMPLSASDTKTFTILRSFEFVEKINDRFKLTEEGKIALFLINEIEQLKIKTKPFEYHLTA